MVLVVSAGFSLALAASKLTERFPVPGPAVFLLAAALASDLFPGLSGRGGTILEGESGTNDPGGIALMLGMLELATHANASFWVVVRELSTEMSVGLAIGIVGSAALLRAMRWSLPTAGLYPLRTLAA